MKRVGQKYAMPQSCDVCKAVVCFFTEVVLVLSVKNMVMFAHCPALQEDHLCCNLQMVVCETQHNFSQFLPLQFVSFEQNFGSICLWSTGFFQTFTGNFASEILKKSLLYQT